MDSRHEGIFMPYIRISGHINIYFHEFWDLNDKFHQPFNQRIQKKIGSIPCPVLALLEPK